MRHAALFALLTTLIVLAGCRATVEIPARGSSYDYENEPNDTDYYADAIPGFPFYGVDGYCGASSDSVDKFYFELRQSGTVHLTLAIDDSRYGDLDLALEDGKYEIDSSEGYGRYEYIDQWLTPGTYYIAVFARSGSSGTGYVLSGEFSRGTHSADEPAVGPAESRELPLKRTDYTQPAKPAETIS